MKMKLNKELNIPITLYPLIQMNGLHTQLLEFMTDIHPIKMRKMLNIIYQDLKRFQRYLVKFLKKWRKEKN